MMSRLLCALLLALLAPTASADLLLQSFDTALHDRFYTGVDKAFIGDGFDWSGIGRTDDAADMWGIMISDSYFLSAAHFSPAIGTTLDFYFTDDPADGFESHTVESGSAIAGTDLFLGKLSTSVSSSIKKYSILKHEFLPAHIGDEIYVVGRSSSTDFPGTANMRVGRNEIDTVESVTVGLSVGISITYDFDDPGGVGADEAMLVTGDSGGPSLTVWDGELVLVGIHWFVTTDPDGSGDTLVGPYTDDISAAMTGESLSLVPEPGSFLLAGLLAAGLVARRRRLAGA